MNDSMKKVEGLNTGSIEDDKNFKKYIIKNTIENYNIDNLIDKDNNENLICAICLNVLKNPISCSDKNNCHSFCKECIDGYLKESNNCPTCKENFEYKKNYLLNNKLVKLNFNCAFKNEGCNSIIPYSDYLNHINNCKYNNSTYECRIMKYNYNYKEFKKCGYTGNKLDIENHFKLCAYIKCNCLFCNKFVLQMNLEEHAKNICKFGIIIYPDGDKYIGEKQNNKAEGYGILYYSDGDRYEGEYKNDNKDGFGILYYSDGDRYEGEWKNDRREGYGIEYLNNGEKYEGKWKSGMRYEKENNFLTEEGKLNENDKKEGI